MGQPTSFPVSNQILQPQNLCPRAHNSADYELSCTNVILGISRHTGDEVHTCLLTKTTQPTNHMVIPRTPSNFAKGNSTIHK